MKTCTKCLDPIPRPRLDLGYTTCVSCSTEPRWSGVQVINHKTGNETEVIKDPETAAEFLRLSSRTGFGILRGMRTTKKSAGNARKNVVQLTETPPVNKELYRRQLPHQFDQVLQDCLTILETSGLAAAQKCLELSLEKRLVYRNQSEQIRSILSHIAVN